MIAKFSSPSPSFSVGQRDALSSLLQEVVGCSKTPITKDSLYNYF
jgi:hypothetical protein